MTSHAVAKENVCGRDERENGSIAGHGNEGMTIIITDELASR